MTGDEESDRHSVTRATFSGIKRIAFLDGLRGIAALGVVGWHHTNWLYEDYFPYGTFYAAIPLLDHGWIGVNLFFLISGYVILMTLERCGSFRDFIARRWIRLFPAMLIASLAIFAISQINGEHMPHGEASPVDLLPGLTFIILTFWTWLLDTPVNELDGVFWTLYVEMGFYFVYGLLFFLVGWRKGLGWLAAIWITTLVMGAVAEQSAVQFIDVAATIPQGIGAAYFGWFISGALFYKANTEASNNLFYLAITTGVIAALNSGLWQPDDFVAKFYLVSCVVFFAVVLRAPMLQAAFSWRLLLFFGGISYPLYLLHNEIGIGLISLAGTALPSAWWPLLPFGVAAIMVAAATMVAHCIEPRLAAILRTRILRGRTLS